MTVLVVDDEELDRNTASEILRRRGFDVLTAESYTDAMSVFNRHRDSIDLLIADVVLPDGNGCVLAVAMRNEKPNLKVLFTSFHVGAEALANYGLNVTDLHFLKKPMEEAKLARAVDRVLTDESFPVLRVPRSLKSNG
jgi:DNA-binding NtrC family response regulator